MTHEEILLKTLEKVKKNGWMSDLIIEDLIYEGFLPNQKGKYENGPYDLEYHLRGYSWLLWFIFTKDFAKSFWGEACPDHKGVEKECDKSWQYHMQQMVLEEDPIMYLAKFL